MSSSGSLGLWKRAVTAKSTAAVDSDVHPLLSSRDRGSEVKPDAAQGCNPPASAFTMALLFGTVNSIDALGVAREHADAEAMRQPHGHVGAGIESRLVLLTCCDSVAVNTGTSYG